MPELSHVLLIVPGFPENENDSTCLPAVQQFVLCYRQQYPAVKISIISLHYPYTRKKYSWYDIEVHPAGNKNKGGLKKAMSMLHIMKTALAVHRQKPIDAILCFWLSDTAVVSKILSHKLDVPYFVWMHGQDAKEGNKYAKRVSPAMEQLIAISEWQNAVFKRAYGTAAAHVIHNGINEKIFPALNTGERDIDLLAAGSLIPLKQYHLFIELVNYLKQAGYSKIRAVLAGDGAMHQQLLALVHIYQLEEQVTLAGKIPHAEVLELMNRAKIFIHPSGYEGHSTVILEALYSGMQVVSMVPVGEKATAQFHLCNDPDEMKLVCGRLLQQPVSHTRVKYSDMADSVRQMHALLAVKS